MAHMKNQSEHKNFIIQILIDLKNHGAFFALVGVIASLAHYVAFVFFIKTMWPEIANIFAFLTSFMISFLGHRYLTFNEKGTPFLDSFIRFFSTACLGFLNNELVLAFLYRIMHFDSKLALICGMLTSAAQTFILSRYWAFQKTKEAPTDSPDQS